MLVWGTRNAKQFGDFHIFPTIKVNVDQQLFGSQIHQNILFCVQHKKELNTCLGQHAYMPIFE